MLDPADTRFLDALAHVLAERDFAACTDCRAAVAKAIETRAPLDLRAARLQADALPGDLRDTLMARVHARMASDLSAIWDMMPHASGTKTPH